MTTFSRGRISFRGRAGALARLAVAVLAVPLALAARPGQAQLVDPTPLCGDEGVWLQILGAGGPELDDDQAPASYVVFVDNRARLLVDTAPGSSVGFDQAGARFADLDAVVFTQLNASHTSDLAGFVAGSETAGRTELLPVLGPDAGAGYPGTVDFVDRLIGPEGVYPYLADYLTFRSSGGYKLSPRNVPATGQRRWARFGSENLRLAAIPVHHGEVPALAWRAEIGDLAIVFTGDFSNQKNVIPEFAEGADALVVHHAIPEGTRGAALERYVTPSQIGRIAAQAGVRMVILGHRTNRTRGLESITRAAIEEHYQGPLIFANDLECWGL